MINHLFSTGQLFIGAVGASLDNTDIVGEIQSASFSCSFQTKEVREANWVNMFPTDNVQYDGDAKFQFEMANIYEALIPYLTGAALSTSGGANVYTTSVNSKPSYFQLKFVGETTDGRAVILIMARVKAPGMPLGMKRDDYTMPQIEATALPIAGATDGTQIPWSLSIAQS